LKRLRPRAVVLLTATLLVGVAVAGCGRDHRTDEVPTPSLGANGSAGPTIAVDSSGSDGPSASVSIAIDSPAPATPDAAASELDQINQLINDINNSIQSSDSSTAGGE
jgi:nitrous oxide reductase accessory protein NosL